MMVEMGTDRVHHAFWRFMDPTHHRYEPGNPFERVIATTTSTSTTRSASCSSASRRHGRAGRLRPRGAAHGRRDRVNEWLIAGGLPRPARAARRHPTPLAGRRSRLGADARLGRGRLLRPALPERPRAASRRAIVARGLRGDARPADRAARGAGRPRRAGRSAPGCSSPRTLYRSGRGMPARPLRLLRRPRAGGRSARVGPRPPLHLRERHRPRRRQPRPGRPVRPGGPRRAGRAP